MKTKQPTYSNQRRSVLTASERKNYQLSLHFDLKAGYPLEIAQQRAWDCVYAQRRSAASTFKSKWGL